MQVFAGTRVDVATPTLHLHCETVTWSSPTPTNTDRRLQDILPIRRYPPS